MADPAGDGPLRHAALAHAANGRGTVRPGIGRQDRQRTEQFLSARRGGGSPSSARSTQDDWRNRPRAGIPRQDHRRDQMHPQTAIPGGGRSNTYLYGRGPAWFAYSMTVGLMIFDYIDRQVIGSMVPFCQTDWLSQG